MQSRRDLAQQTLTYAHVTMIRISSYAVLHNAPTADDAFGSNCDINVSELDLRRPRDKFLRKVRCTKLFYLPPDYKNDKKGNNFFSSFVIALLSIVALTREFTIFRLFDVIN